jgi:hypothetical protein
MSICFRALCTVMLSCLMLTGTAVAAPAPAGRRDAARLVAGVQGVTAAAAQAVVATPTAPAIERVLNRLYNWDLASAQALLAEYTSARPEDPVGWALIASAHLFGEFERLRVLELDFFTDDVALVDEKKKDADPVVREKIFDAVARVRSIAEPRLAKNPNDREALLGMCIISSATADYTSFVERRHWRGATLEKQSVAYANKLLALSPPEYDAYYTRGAVEYIVGSLPFYVRWFVRYDQVDPDKRKGIEHMKIVARQGRIFAPLARILLAVASMREGKLADARQWLEGFVADYPENALIRRELERMNQRIERAKKK